MFEGQVKMESEKMESDSSIDGDVVVVIVLVT